MPAQLNSSQQSHSQHADVFHHSGLWKVSAMLHKMSSRTFDSTLLILLWLNIACTSPCTFIVQAVFWLIYLIVCHQFSVLSTYLFLGWARTDLQADLRSPRCFEKPCSVMAPHLLSAFTLMLLLPFTQVRPTAGSVDTECKTGLQNRKDGSGGLLSGWRKCLWGEKSTTKQRNLFFSVS